MLDAFCAKFRVHSIIQRSDSQSIGVEVNLYLLNDRPENRYFWQGTSEGTPAGRIQMVMANPEAIAYFELGKEYDVTFAAVEQS